jgi:hypothetical protein
MKNLITFAVALLTLSAPALADISVDLIADGGDTAFDAGDVDISYDGANIIVTITVDQSVDPWELVETHVHVAATAEEVPQKNGNPRPGQFDYCNLDAEATTVTPTVHEYEIPYDLDEDDDVVVAVHAAIEWLEIIPDPDGEGPLTEEEILHEETGWGEGTAFYGKNWAMYIEGELACAWDLTGSWVWRFMYNGTSPYDHDMDVTIHQWETTGDFMGIGGYPAGGPYTKTWVVTGNVDGDNVDMLIEYDGNGYWVDAEGTIAGDGTMSGTACTSSQGCGHTWLTTSGEATRACTLQQLP